MKDKNKKILGISLAVISVVIVVVCLYIFLSAGEKGKGFSPGASPEPHTSSWAASPAPKETAFPSSVSSPEAQSSKVEYPKVVQETSSEVVVDFTEPTEPAKEPAGEPEPESPPVPDAPSNDGESYDPPPTQGETGGGGGQTDGGGGGTVNDPVFGDVTPGQGQQQGVDNDGNPDKVVGIM